MAQYLNRLLCLLIIFNSHALFSSFKARTGAAATQNIPVISEVRPPEILPNMIQTIEAVIDRQGRISLKEKIKTGKVRRALLTILDDEIETKD